MAEIKLERPIIFFDLETTGTNVTRDCIVEISVVKIFPDGHQQVHTKRVNPEMPIPEGASAVHGIYDADVANEPPFSVMAANLMRYFEGCDIGGYNILKFDIPMLINEFNRVGLSFSMEGRRVVDVYNIFCKLYPRTLGAAYQFFCGKELADAHSAEADTIATIEVLHGQLAKHPELGNSLEELHKLSESTMADNLDAQGRFKWSGPDVVIGFGKYAGTALKTIAAEEPGFLRWILKADFPDDVKKIASDALAGTFPRRKTDA